MSSYFGLDIGSSSIKVVQSSLLGAKGFVLNNIGLVQNPGGSVDFTDQRLTAKLGPAIKQAMTEAGIRDKRVVVSVPESRAYSRIVEMPNMSDAELSSAVNWEAEQFIPLPVAEVEIDYTVVRRPPKGSEQKMLVYLVAAPKKYLQSMVDFLLAIGIEPIAVESEMVAIARAFTFGETQGSSLIVHIGALSTIISIVEGDSLLFSYVVNSGGLAMTRAISQSLALPIAQAEEYKRTYGMDEKQLEGKVRGSLLVVVESLVTEMRKASEFYMASHKSQIQRIVLSGGGAYLPELNTYLSGVFGGLEVIAGDPFMFAKNSKNASIPQERAAYSVATGLSLRVF